MKGTIISGSCSDSTHSQTSNSRYSGGELDVCIHASEAHREPFLAIATIAPADYALGDLGRHIVMKPVPTLGQDLDPVGADLLLQLAQRCFVRGFASIDAALRHLPFGQARWHLDAATDEDQAIAVEQHYPNPLTVVGKLVLPRPHRQSPLRALLYI